jgi:hypothetical protein
MAVYDLSKMSTLSTAMTQFAIVMSATLVNERSQITQANLASERLEDIYDGVITRTDSYADSNSFVARTVNTLVGNTLVISAAKSISNILDTVVVTRQIHSGIPWIYPSSIWTWLESKGLSMYLPTGRHDDARRALYTSANLQWVKDTRWDRFLAAYLEKTAQPSRGAETTADLPTCETTQQCPALLKPMPIQIRPRAYLPILFK